MPAIKEFTITEKQLRRRLPSEIQQKLKIVMKCYTIRNFVLNGENRFSFQMSHMINKRRLDSERILNGSYIVENIGEGQHKLRITVN